ncbi:hypothetical protein ACFL0D_02255 [Thermoproteota archaeon]
MSSEENCGECPNPLVELKKMDIEGDISAIHGLIQEFEKGETRIGWENLLKGIPSDFDSSQRAAEYLGFRKRNPCADIYYMRETHRGLIRVGVKKTEFTGKALYNVKSVAKININVGQALVIKKTEGGGIPTHVPLVGTIEIHHTLTALKNGETYDSGEESIDWIREPPEGEEYYRDPNNNRGLFQGAFDTSDLTGATIVLDKGDIGITIRKKETPSTCSLEVDEISVYPPFYLMHVEGVRNFFNELLPDEVRIALKVDEGSLQGGEVIEGWKVFTTVKGGIPVPILFEPPDCSKVKSATLKIAAVCDWHDGEPSVGEPRISKSIPIPQCYRVSAKITRKLNYKNDWTRQDDPYSTKRTSHWEEEKKLTVFTTFESQPSEVTSYDDGRLEYRYRMNSHSVTSYSFSGKGNGSEHMPLIWDIIWKTTQRGRPSEVIPDDESDLVLVVDAKTKKVLEASLPSFGVEIHWIGFHECKRSIHPLSSYLKESYDEDCSYSIDDTDTFYAAQGESNKTTMGDGVYLFGDRCEEVHTDETSSTKDVREWHVYRN